MIQNYRNCKDCYRVTVNIDPEKSRPLIDAAIAKGVLRVFIVRARGVLHKNKVGFFTLPGISPSFDVINMIVPEKVLPGLLEELVRVGKLDHFGAGSIYASKITDLWYGGTDLFDEAVPADKAAGNDYDFQRDLVAINCICQLDHAEEIALAAMLSGSPSPTICYGYGHGIRDRLGPFLRLTINPKKEYLELVVGSEEADRVLESMVRAGHLDKPARGFIFTRPIDVGMINTVSYQQTTLYPATMEQIIKAIDQMQGSTNWRSRGSLKTSTIPEREKLRNLVSLNCIVNRGFGDVCSMAALEAGAGGTSAYYANALPIENKATHAFDYSDEREIIALTIGEDQVASVAEAITSVKELEGTPVILFTYPAPIAVTYIE